MMLLGRHVTTQPASDPNEDQPETAETVGGAQPLDAEELRLLHYTVAATRKMIDAYESRDMTPEEMVHLGKLKIALSRFREAYGVADANA